jgi:hypothetical protein
MNTFNDRLRYDYGERDAIGAWRKGRDTPQIKHFNGTIVIPHAFDSFPFFSVTSLTALVNMSVGSPSLYPDTM